MEELAARFINALVLMRAKEIALRLQQVRRQPRIAKSIEIVERSRKRRDPDSV
jgi:hypothetical protein